MENGFLKVALSNLSLIIADPITNVKTIIEKINCFKDKNVKIFLTPELSLIGNSCNDLLFNNDIINDIEISIKILMNNTKNIDMLIIIGTSLFHENSLLNVSIIFHKGEIIGIIPKNHISNKNIRYYNNNCINKKIILLNQEYDLTKYLIINDINFHGLSIGLIFSDLFKEYQDINFLKNNGVNIILNPCNYIINDYISSKFISNQISIISKQTNTIILTSSNGYGESHSKNIFLGYNGIFECGKKLGQSDIFTFDNDIVTEIDFNKSYLLSLSEKKHLTLDHNIKRVKINFEISKTILTRKFNNNLFLESLNLIDDNNNNNNLNKIFNMQVFALKNKLIASKTNGIIIAFSGGMDSTLALIIAHKCCLDLNMNLLALMMPGLGTSNNSFNNSKDLLKLLNINSKIISIINSTKQHFIDIDHSINIKNNVYENAQARERTQIALDLANKLNYIFVGSSNLSEIALGWTTFAGDNISHYSINSGIPKTVIKKLLKYISLNIKDYLKIKNIINNIIQSPISPELIQNQNTEDIIGPYELHDFFLYCFLYNRFKFNKIYDISCYTFNNKYTKSKIKKCLKIFIKRFFSQQFKRNCCIEGLKVFNISLSTYDDFILTSDLQSEYLIKKFLQFE